MKKVDEPGATHSGPLEHLPRARGIAASATAGLEERVVAMRTAGRSVYRLGLGEPDFSVPDHVAEAAVRAIRERRVGYTETAGVGSLREAIAERFSTDLGLAATPDNVMASAGAKQAINHALAVLCADADEVLIPVPFWVSFPEQVRLAGGRPVFIHPSASTLKVTAAEIADAATPDTRGLILNSPNNPSGAVYSAGELEALAEVCIRLDLWVISDEVYRTFVYDGVDHSSIGAIAGMAGRTIVVDSASKTYGMPGWRLGYATGPADVIAAMIAVASHTTSNPSVVSQAAAEAALRGPQDAVQVNRHEYGERASWLVDRLARIRQLTCSGSIAGGFFSWVDVSAATSGVIAGRRIHSAAELADFALEACGVVLQSGEAFGSSQHVRLSIAAPRPELEEGLDRLQALLEA